MMCLQTLMLILGSHTVHFSMMLFVAFGFRQSEFTGATAAVCIGFIFPAAVTLRDPHDIATKKDKIISVFMIVLAVFSNLVAIYSDAVALFKKNSSPSD
ncbi:Amino acid transporter avt6b [Thalictrum thalictroides]|uniref:Amino acid transporter avt6b n=1 Tax=Thalictrum thalictroides TaxID=46969 RepID=A0A7J6W9Y3_THATH|nr:Amino acid transporter avt6b [Thalictrum thalictroides]